MSGARKLGTSSYGSKLLQKTASSSSEWEGTSFDYQSEDHDDVDGMETNDVVEGGGRVEEDLGNMAIHQDGLDEPKATPNNEVRHLRKRPRRMIVSESVTPERAMNELNDQPSGKDICNTNFFVYDCKRIQRT
ncbi:hypothetical protein BGZ58_010028 [Dissophora ornata]|nr:hypothetical protein BGZ58_010028 [Dissophora ornata]